MQLKHSFTLLSLSLVTLVNSLFWGSDRSAQAQPSTAAPSAFALPITYGEKGFTFNSSDGLFSLSLQNRIQFRYANPFDSDPRSVEDLLRNESAFMIRRGRTKLKGHAYWPWLKYYLQYDWSDPVLRDLNLTLDKYPWANLWVGRGKVVYNDERVTSSGKQQFVNRSILNDIFTVDRQQGLQLTGDLFEKQWYHLSYATGIFTGMGVGERSNDEGSMMYSGRLQWNPLGGGVDFSQSDLDMRETPALSLAVAAATNQSRCTAFATSLESCRSLPGFEIGEAGQYRLNQLMQEARFKWKGLSFKQELHGKEVIDTLQADAEPGRSTPMLGNLVQVGYFPHAALPIIPKEIELAARYAFVDPNLNNTDDLQQEISGVVNYFFYGHNNKISLQFSHLMVDDPEAKTPAAAQRLWLQWDISF